MLPRGPKPDSGLSKVWWASPLWAHQVDVVAVARQQLLTSINVLLQHFQAAPLVNLGVLAVGMESTRVVNERDRSKDETMHGVALLVHTDRGKKRNARLARATPCVRELRPAREPAELASAVSWQRWKPPLRVHTIAHGARSQELEVGLETPKEIVLDSPSRAGTHGSVTHGRKSLASTCKWTSRWRSRACAA